MIKDRDNFLIASLFGFNWEDSGLDKGDFSIHDIDDGFKDDVEAFILGFDNFLELADKESKGEEIREAIDAANGCVRSFGGSIYFSLSGHGVGFWDESEPWGDLIQELLETYAKENYERGGEGFFEEIDFFKGEDGMLRVQGVDFTAKKPKATLIQTELSRLVENSDVLNFQMNDFEGNKTRFLGLNDAESIDSLIEFLNRRKEGLK